MALAWLRPVEVDEKGPIVAANGAKSWAFAFGQTGVGNMVGTIHMDQAGAVVIEERAQDNIPTDKRGKGYHHMALLPTALFTIPRSGTGLGKLVQLAE